MPNDYIDISVPLSSEMVTWPGHEPSSFSRSQGMLDNARYYVTRLNIGSHTGTHVDAPVHFTAGGVTVDRIDLGALIGEAQVCDMRGIVEIGPDELAAAGVGDVPRVLIATDNSAWIRTGPMPNLPAHLTPAAAGYLVDRNLALVGFDGLSIDHPDKAAAHLRLLSAGTIILEAIDLTDIPPGRYDLICLPLRIASGDGAPARALLRPISP